jgi:amidase
VADVRLAMAVMSRRDIRDPWWVPAPLTGPALPGSIKVAVAKIPADMQADPEVVALIDQAAGYLTDAGYEVCDVDIPDVSAAWRIWCDLICAEMSLLQVAQMREVGGADFIQALSGFMTLANTLDAEGYARALAQRTRMIREWLIFLETYPLIVAPVSSRKTPSWNYDLGGDDAVRSFFWNDFRFTSAISVLGLPAAATPIGSADGHPVGVQLIASRFREDVCLDAAAAIEARVGILAHSLWARG